ncbi:diaminopimelate decarboxylase [Alkalidesulfovibrio alkalitolerans DSM 16529]|uniref:Diaminopimelate decarboxylase n=1 Tax=Alkalidesulfovibrio alkalitolerans DSM 16529 TaxID=1121439 RepID=S7T1J2_9BACT|nr:diaminopimelate decarboxylase [Alkalidesulfovibrio alkalitolerans]EPR30416.1 diaminopimelate decarboxylase [Alkalidesulfovibrio alkalitolerans DSM 16529]
MNHFEYRNDRLFAEDVPVEEIVARFGTPTYVYSSATFRRHFEAFDSAFARLPHMVCYSVKANSNIHILRLLAEKGAGVDIVSGGELYRALKAGVPGGRIVFSGVAKTADEIEDALKAGILMFNAESLDELKAIDATAARLGKKARVALRINPDVDPKTHPYISTGMKKNKFGLDMETALVGYEMARDMTNVEPVGIDCHIGSQLTTLEPFLEALDKVLGFYRRLKDMGIEVTYLDLGGGLGITYNEEEPPHPSAFGEALTERLKDLPLTLILEPGRVISGNAGILAFRTLYTKTTPVKKFLIVDAAMNDLVRPSLYGSYHRIEEVAKMGRPVEIVDIVGGICESTDFLARDREMPAVEPGEYLAAFSAGAYGMTMSSQYNSRRRAAEVLVDGAKVRLIRRRETYDDIIAPEMESE